MINLFTLKKQRSEQAQDPGAAKKTTAGQIRLQKDMDSLDLPSTIKLDVPDKDNLMRLHLAISPDEGYYEGGTFDFEFQFKNTYPHDPPKVKCTQKIYHPNIDLDGNVCLNTLREDWKPVLNVQSIVVGLQFLFLEPNPDDPLNKEAAQVLRSNRRQFENNVKMSMGGGQVNGVLYDRVKRK